MSLSRKWPPRILEKIIFIYNSGKLLLWTKIKVGHSWGSCRKKWPWKVGRKVPTMGPALARWQELAAPKKKGKDRGAGSAAWCSKGPWESLLWDNLVNPEGWLKPTHPCSSCNKENSSCFPHLTKTKCIKFWTFYQPLHFLSTYSILKL